MNTKKLIKRAKRGHKKAIVTLIMAQQHDYYRLAYIYVENEHDAMDALENMIVIIYHKIKQLQNEDAFYSWSKTILVNECRAILRQKKRMIFLEDETILEQTVDPIESFHLSYEIEHYLSILSPVQKEAISLKYLLDYDYETIATLTNTSVSTAKTRVFYGLQKIRQHVEKEDLQ